MRISRHNKSLIKRQEHNCPTGIDKHCSLLCVALLWPFATLVLVSCNLQTRIGIEAQGVGTMQISLKLPPYMLGSLDVLAASIPGGEEWLEPKRIAQQLEATKGISAVRVAAPQKGAYDIRFRFENLTPKGRTQQFLKWVKRSDGTTRLQVQINRSTWQALKARFPSLGDNPLLLIYGPGTTQDLSRSDYLDMIEYSFGAQARSDLISAEAQIVLELPGRIVSHSGGEKTGAKSLELRLPLLDFLLLQREQLYNVIYRHTGTK